jgi:hypothetical protein
VEFCEASPVFAVTTKCLLGLIDLVWFWAELAHQIYSAKIKKYLWPARLIAGKNSPRSSFSADGVIAA